MSVAIVHDQFRTMGGAEKVACAIARTLDAPVYAMRVDESVPPADVEVTNLAGRVGEWCMNRHWTIQDAYQMFAWQHCPEIYDYETIILTKNNPAWFVPHVDSQTVIRYCHSPPRGMFDQFHRRGERRLKRPMFTIQRLLYQQTTPYADRWLCNSEVVARRVRRYLDPADAPIEVVYPPVETAQTGPQHADTQDYLFAIGRLAVNKRTDLLLNVARETNHEVVVAGDGPYRSDIENATIPNLTYVGRISDREKWRRFSEAQATLFLAENEDFGIVPIESMAAGTPVIGVDEGYTSYQIQDGQNGYLVAPTVASVVAGIETLAASGVAWTQHQISTFADQFSTERFEREITEQVATTKANRQINPDYEMPTQPVSTDD